MIKTIGSLSTGDGSVIEHYHRNLGKSMTSRVNAKPIRKEVVTLYDLSIIMILIFVGVVLAGVASKNMFYPDNPIEEASEEIIEDYTHVDIDLSPESPEK